MPRSAFNRPCLTCSKCPRLVGSESEMRGSLRGGFVARGSGECSGMAVGVEVL